jgi:hypothetical protein
MWQYLSFLIHVREKPLDALNGPEMVVYRKMKRKDISFLPLSQAICLSAGLPSNRKSPYLIIADPLHLI